MTRARLDAERGRRALPWLAGSALLAAVALVLLAVTPAQAAAKRTDAQLALSGVSTADSPTGGSQVGVHPGDSVRFSAASVPTAGLAKLGLGDLVSTVDGLLNGAAGFRIEANFSKLPGGKKNTALSGSKTVTFHFPKAGTYNFTWVVQKVSLLGGLLGSKKSYTTINLDGNELKKAGIKLNASNQYVGQVVVAKKPPKGGLGLQVPTIKVAPSVTGVGQLPTITVPGTVGPTITVPSTLPVSLPTGGLLHPGGGKSSTTKHTASHHPTQPHSSTTKTVESIPEMIVPKAGSTVIPGGNQVGLLPSASRQDVTGVTTTGPQPASSSKAPAASTVDRRQGTGKNKTIDLSASQTPDPSGQLPVILAIASIIVLALVAGTYARIFLNKRNL